MPHLLDVLEKDQGREGNQREGPSATHRYTLPIPWTFFFHPKQCLKLLGEKQETFPSLRCRHQKYCVWEKGGKAAWPWGQGGALPALLRPPLRERPKQQPLPLQEGQENLSNPRPLPSKEE